MTKARDFGLLAGFLFSIVGVLVTPWCTRDRITDTAPWVDAVKQNVAALAPGSVVLVHPPWRDDVVRAVRAAAVLPPGVTATATLAPRHGEPLPPLFVVREAGGVVLPRNLRDVVERDAGGGLRVGLLAGRAPAISARRDLLDDLSLAHAEVRLPDRTVTCAWDPFAQRHSCPDLPDWVHVGMEELPIASKRERCAWAHPITNGTLSITFFGPVAPGTLDLSLALSDTAADNPSGAEVTATLFIDDEERARVARGGKRGFASTSAPIRDTAQSVRVEITTPHDGQRHACFRLTSGGAQ